MPPSFTAATRDSLSNLAASLGAGRDKAASDAFVLWDLDRSQIEAMHRGDWLARKVVDIVPYDMVRAWRSWSGHPADVARVEAAERRLGLRKALQRAMVLGRLYGGGALIIGTGETDPAALARPLDPDSVGPGGLKFLHVVSRFGLNAPAVDRDPLSPWYGDAVAYELVAPGRGALVLHPSRVLRFLGNPLPDPSLVPTVWSDSVLQVLYDAIHAVALTTAGATSLMHEAKVDIVTVPNLSEHLGSADTTAQLSARFAYAAAMKSINNLLLLGDGETWARRSVDFAGLPEMVRTFLQVAAGAADIPVTRLLGQSPAGLSATGDGDTRNYYDMIAGRQELDLRPQLERLDRLILRSEGIDPGALTFAFRPLWQMDAPAKAALALAKAQATQIYAGLDLWPAAVTARLVEAQLVADGTYPNAAAVFAEREPGGVENSGPTLDFNWAQPRDPDGRWTEGGSSARIDPSLTETRGQPPLAPLTTEPALAEPSDRPEDSPHGLSKALGNILGALDPIATASAHEPNPPGEQAVGTPAVPTAAQADPITQAAVLLAIPLLATLSLRQASRAAVREIVKHLPDWLTGGALPGPVPPAKAADPSPPPLTVHGEAVSLGAPGFSPAPGLPPSVTPSPLAQASPSRGAGASPVQTGTAENPYSFSEQVEDPQEKARQQQIRQDIEKRFENTKEHITDKDLTAAWQESRGDFRLKKPDGTPYDHVTEVKQAQTKLKGIILDLKGLLGRPRLLPSETRPLQDLLGEASRSLDQTEEFIPSDRQGTGDHCSVVSLLLHDEDVMMPR